MCLNHLRVCLVGRLVDWLSDRLLWLIVCLFFCLSICCLLVCWFVGLVLRPFVRLFGHVFVYSFLYICQCPTPDGATLDIPSICWPGGAPTSSINVTNHMLLPHLSNGYRCNAALVSLCVWICLSECLFGWCVGTVSEFNLFAFERATLCRLFVCMCVGAS